MSEPFNRTAAAAAARDFGADLENDDGLEGEFSMIADYPEEADYYALLGLSQKPPPTDTEIRSAYRNLTLSFHPDKQPAHLREPAEQHFNRIQEAYETLIDSKKRTVYDILGAEGVRREWGRLGAMGVGGEAQKQQVGVKAMSPDQFRRWFVKTMKKRERKAVESLVSSRGSITLGINAASTIHVVDDDDVRFQFPSDAKPVSYGAQFSFNAPLPLPKFGDDTEEGAEEKESSVEANVQEEEETEPVQVTINAGISGNLVRPSQPISVEYEDGTTQDSKVILPYILMAKNISLGATVRPDLRELVGATGIWGKRPLSVLRDSTILLEANVFPIPLLKTTVARSFQPIPGIKPFQVTASSSIQRSLLESPPAFEVHVTKEVAERKLAFCAWSSGLWYWPELLLERCSSLGMSLEDMYASSGDLSSFQVGMVALPKVPSNAIELGDDDEEDEHEELRRLLRKKKDIDNAAESWQAFIQASPGGGGLGLTYARNLFSGSPSNDPVKTEWTDEGYSPMTKMEDARAVRVEISTTVSPALSLGWTIKGTRRVGEYSKFALGVGFTEQGILMTIGWNRLGQGLNVPIVLCSKDEATHDAAVLVNVFTWAAYLAIEFGYIRPRDKKKRRQAIARRHKELKKLIPKKRAESEQAIELMADQVQRRQAREVSQNGLVIVKAEYGYYPPAGKKARPGFEEPRVINVTIPVAALVDRGQLVIRENTVKFQIIGFHDPAPLLKKQLKIWYRFQGRDHLVEVGDKESIACPQRAHMI
ncbi:hypothetical protein N7462_003638 [Penicillium macrosclerotiorum]|uniref:uncharacterized protein n=1 Tax=Penicillium macrosclerotiorum TaxID=303699 RepID=UPI002547C324|nr:uncharacterized protein N7462_003638 [Penicillium macrosclerotiorum]KAJ5689246.1 hypothetical protein N7462_003638 [Penicillium macrosclerotiorum]